MSHGPIILPFNGVSPRIHPSCFIAPGAVVIGDVEIGEDSNIWFGCVLRGDVQSIRVGARSNIQDGTIVHVTRQTGPTTIGSGVTIGHSAVIHACSIEDDAFVGMHSTVMDHAVVSRGGMLAAGALLAPRKVIPTGELWAGNPAKLFRPMKQEEIDFIPVSAAHYVALSKQYQSH